MELMILKLLFLLLSNEMCKFVNVNLRCTWKYTYLYINVHYFLENCQSMVFFVFMVPFQIGFNCLKTTETLQGETLLLTSKFPIFRSTSEGWIAEWICEALKGFELGTTELGIQHPRKNWTINFRIFTAQLSIHLTN